MGQSTSKIFHILGLIIITLFLAVGLLYALRGNIYLTGALAVLPAIAFVFLVPLLERKKQAEEGKIQELVFGIIYGIVAVASFFFFFHGIDIEFNRKDSIKKAAYDKLDKVDKLFKDYADEGENRLRSFKNKVESSLAAYFINRSEAKKAPVEKMLGKGSIDYYKSREAISKQAKAAIEAKQQVMRDGFALGDVVEQWNDYKGRIRPIIDNWNRLNISFAYYDIDNMYKKVYEATQKKMSDFKYADKVKGVDIALDKPFTALGQSSALSIVLLLLFYALAQVFTLMPYIVAKRPKKKNWARDTNKEGTYTGEIKL